MIGFLSSKYFCICAANSRFRNHLTRSCSLRPCHIDQSTYLLSSDCNRAPALDDVIDSKFYVCTCPDGGFCQDPDAWLRIDLEHSNKYFAGRIWDRVNPNLQFNFSTTLDEFSIWVGDSDTTYNATGNSKCRISQTFRHLATLHFYSFLCECRGRYVFFQPTAIFGPNTNPAINFAEIQLYPTLDNLAHACIDGACPVTQSSYYGNPSCSAIHANDDDMTTFVCTCPGGASACSDLDPWVRIDLQQSLSIIAGTVIDRHMGIPSRMVRKHTCKHTHNTRISSVFTYFRLSPSLLLPPPLLSRGFSSVIA